MDQQSRLVINVVCSITLVAFVIILIVCAVLYKRSQKAQRQTKDQNQIGNLQEKIKNKSLDMRYYFPKNNRVNPESIKSNTNRRLFFLFAFLILWIIAMIALLIYANTGLVLESYQIL